VLKRENLIVIVRGNLREKMSSGYLYCFENVCMPGLVKVGMTTREVEERLREANSSDTYKPPLPYTVSLTKKVKNVQEAEKFVHRYLETYGERVNKRREFFKVSINTVKNAFEMVEQEPDSCIICQEEGTVEKYLVQNLDCTCKYFYHESCFPQERRKRCPLCTREIKRQSVAVVVHEAPMTMSGLRVVPTAPPAVPGRVIVGNNRVPLLSSQPYRVQQRVQEGGGGNQISPQAVKKLLAVLIGGGVLIVIIMAIVIANHD
jgi:hypothetical protein